MKIRKPERWRRGVTQKGKEEQKLRGALYNEEPRIDGELSRARVIGAERTVANKLTDRWIFHGQARS